MSPEVVGPPAESRAAVTVDVAQLAAALATLNRSTRRELQLPMGTSSIACLVSVRQVDRNDRRSAFLESTPSGRAVLARIRADRAAALTARLERLTEQQRAALAAAVSAIEALASA